MKMYKTLKWSDSIEDVEITKESETSVFFTKNGREYREKKHSSYHHYHASKADAIEFLKNKHINVIKYARETLEKSNKALELLESLEKQL